MAKKQSKPLNDAQKAFIVQHLACYDSPREVAAAVKEEYGIDVNPQRVECYDPNKRAGQNLSQKWRELFKSVRDSFLKHVDQHIPECNKAVRCRYLANAARTYRAKGNYVAMADMLERVAKELGNVHTNRRELSGRDGKPIEFADMTEDQLDNRLAYLLKQGGVEAITGDDEQADEGANVRRGLH